MRKKIQIIIMFVGITSLLYGQNSDSIGIEPVNQYSLNVLIQKIMTQYEIPGLVISVFTEDDVINKGAYGVRRFKTSDSISINDRFHLGSCGKAMTGFVAARLIEKGLFSWDTKILDIFPEFNDSTQEIYKNVTIEELLTHRSRLMQFVDFEDFTKLPYLDTLSLSQKRYQFTKWILKQEPVELNTKKGYTYTNSGYAVAASMMEKITGENWSKIISKELFIPLNIEVTYSWPAMSNINQPWGHWIKEGDSLLTSHSPDDDYKLADFMSPAGNYSMSILDYTKFLQVNLQGLTGKDTLLKSTTYNYLHFCKFEDNFGYSIGWWVIKNSKGQTNSFHNGSLGTFYCWTTLNPANRIGYAIIANSDSDKLRAGFKKINNYIEEYYNIK